MAQAARPPPPAAQRSPNPCAAFRPPPPPPARRPDAAAPWSPRPKDAPCPVSGGATGPTEQRKRSPENVMHKPSGGSYSKPEARVKLIPVEDITYVRHGKTFGRTAGSDKLEKRQCRRSVTPPPSSRKVSLARSTPLPYKDRTQVTHTAVTQLTRKAPTQLTHKATTQLTRKATSPLAHRPTSPPPPVASCLSAKRFETAENSQISSLNRPSPLCKSVQRGAVLPSVLQKESDMNPISPSSVHVLPARSSKVCLATKTEPFSRSVSTLDNTKICSTSNQATLKSQRTKKDAVPITEKECTEELSLLSPTPVLSISSTQESPETRSKPSSSLKLFDGKCKLASLQPETNIHQAISPQSTTQEPCVELSHDSEAASSTKSHIRNERQTNLEASISCSMSSGAPAISHTELYKKPDQSKSTTQAPCVELSNDFEAVPSTNIHIRNERQINQEASVSCNMSSGAQAILDTELYKKPYQPESKTPGPFIDLSNDLDDVPSTKRGWRNERQTNQEASTSCDMPSGDPLILHTEPRKKTDQPDACWKGKFEVTGELTHTCDELEAHLPHEVFMKVKEASEQMPEVLKLEALPLSHLLPKKFKLESPHAHDIGLRFISSHQRPNRNFDNLLEKISSRIGLRTDIGTTELLIFSSKLLIEDDQTKDGNVYFCGIFRKRLRKKSGIKLLELTGEEETNGINKCMPMLRTLDVNAISKAAPAVSYFTGSCSPVSAGSPCKATPPACNVLDSRSGFPLDAPPPGFTSAHRRLRTGETASSSLVLGNPDVPPGFTPAHRGLHTNGVSTEKKSTIKFSLNITRPVPPGFSKPIGIVNEKEIKHDKVDVEGDDGSEERPFPKIKRLSDIMGFSSSNDASTLCMKRGQPEASESSTAEATKRLRVNGRIALNRSVDRCALNSNQAQGNGGKS